MLNNPNSGIRTDFQTDDVFTTTNANQLARAIHYDFVITQEKLDNWIEKHADSISSNTGIPVSQLIASNLDGSDPATWTAVKAPISIFIAAKLDTAYAFIFESLFTNAGVALSTGTGVPFMDWTDFQVDGTYDPTATDGVVNVYSAYPYRSIYVSGGINFWSTVQAPVTIRYGFSNNGICRVGAYGTESVIDLGSRNQGQLILTRCVSGTPIQVNPTVPQIEGGDYEIPCAYYANWMSGGGVTYEYAIAATDTSKPGLFQQLVYTVAAGTLPILTVVRGNSTARYMLTEQGTEKWRFANMSEGYVVNIAKNGGLTWESISSTISGSSNGRVLIYDTDISELPSYGNAVEGLQSMYSDKCGASVSVVRTGGTSFLSVSDDTGEDTAWYQNQSGKMFEFKGATVLDWNLWNGISDRDPSDNTIKWYPNSRTVLYVNAESLTEGVVYEINIHVIYLPFAPVPSTGSGTPDLWVQGNPANPPSTPAGYTGAMPRVWFCTASGSGYANIRHWNTANVLGGGGDYSAKPAFIYNDLSDNFYLPLELATLRNEYGFLDIATAKLPFVKLGGYIYLMAY